MTNVPYKALTDTKSAILAPTKSSWLKSFRDDLSKELQEAIHGIKATNMEANQMKLREDLVILSTRLREYASELQKPDIKVKSKYTIGELKAIEVHAIAINEISHGRILLSCLTVAEGLRLQLEFNFRNIDFTTFDMWGGWDDWLKFRHRLTLSIHDVQVEVVNA